MNKFVAFSGMATGEAGIFMILVNLHLLSLKMHSSCKRAVVQGWSGEQGWQMIGFHDSFNNCDMSCKANPVAKPRNIAKAPDICLIKLSMRYR